MKIGYIYPSFYPGNVPFYVHTQKLAELGCQVHAIAIRREDERPHEIIGQVQVERVPTRLTPDDRYRSSFASFLLSAHHVLSQDNDWDIIHVANIPGSSLLPLLAQRNEYGWVLDIRSPPLHKKSRALISKLRIRLESRAFDETFAHSLAVGEAIFGLGSTRFVELPIGVDFDHFRPGTNTEVRLRLGVAPDQKILIYTGVIRPKRRLDKLLAGFQQADQQVGGLHLLVVGEGPDRQRLQDLAQEMGIAERVHFVGVVPYDQMPRYLWAADIGLGYVPMTPMFDKAPVLKTLESLAAGLPTIATATEGNQAYITNRRNGLLVEDSPEAIADGITELCRNDDLYRKLANAGASIREYDWARIVEDVLLSTYNAVCTRRARSPER